MAFISSGTTIIDNGAFQSSLGSLVHIKTLTASSSATLSFVHGTDGVVLDSTYPIYRFEFINIHPSADGVEFNFQGSTDGGSNYNTTITSTAFYATHGENGSFSDLAYDTSDDFAQGTGYLPISYAGGVGNANDNNLSGYIQIFNPSSTTFVKHFMGENNATRINAGEGIDYSPRSFYAGYFNNTNDIDAVSFKFNSGNIDSGKIKLYGIKDS